MLFALALISAGCFEDEPGFGVRDAPVLHAYAADRIYHCPVPSWDSAGSVIQVYEGAELVLRSGNLAQLTFYSSHGSGADPDAWQADTLRVTGTYRRDGFTLEFRFDEGYVRSVHAVADMLEEGRLTFAFEDGGALEFVPIEQKPTGPAEYCDA